MTLPLVISVPHAGLDEPEELRGAHQLTPEQIAEDGDVQAAEIYAIEEHVAAFVTTPIARAFVDMNRAPNDIRKDGIVKSHTCWDVPIWRERPSDELFQQVIDRYHTDYHRRLTELAGAGIIGVDCHTMADFGPPVGPDPGQERPLACIGTADGTCPPEWAEALAVHLRDQLGVPVKINEPFRGGFIIRSHAPQMPWLMLELSRTPRVSTADKHRAVLAAFTAWAGELEL